MNYFELINKCLMELNYQRCKEFANLSKNDHSKLKNIINVINSEVCSFDNWNFLLRKKTLTLPKNSGEVENTIPGRINSLVIDKIKYSFVEDYDRFLMNTESANTYSVFNDKILFPQFCEDKPVDITYYTNNFAKDADGNDIQSMSAENDKPLIPEIFAEPILVYGACMRFKGNPEYTKFNYWYSMYKTALATMRSKIATSANATPTIKLYRG